MRQFFLTTSIILMVSNQYGYCQSPVAEKANAASPVFTIEVPGPKIKDPEKEASQYFKNKVKEQISEHPQEKVVSMRLSGSLCPACLKALAARFQNTAGVISATIELPSKVKQEAATTVENATSTKMPRFALAKITFDANVLTVERIKEIVRQNDLAYWNVTVK